MLRNFRMTPFECFQEFSAESVRFSRSILLIVFFLASAACVPDAIGQEITGEPANSTVEVDEDNGPEELLAAMKSLDETLNRKSIEERKRNTQNRLVGIGLIGGTILGLLGVLFGYLRMDHATRGFHSGRLQLVAGLISIAILASGYFLWTQVLFK